MRPSSRLADEGVATDNDSHFVSQILGSWSQHVKSWTDIKHDRFLTLRYEDLVSKPAKTFAKVAKLAGIGQDRSRIDRAVRNAGFATLSAMEKKHGFVEASDTGTRFFRKGKPNEWREALSREQIQKVVADHRSQMARFGYIPAGY